MDGTAVKLLVSFLEEIQSYGRSELNLFSPRILPIATRRKSSMT